jgi:hypothetical protein
MRLEQALVLNRYLHGLFGARDLAELKPRLTGTQQGPDGNGQSHFAGVLAGLQGSSILEERLLAHDRQVMAYEARMSAARGPFSFKYFQYLALLYSDIYLGRLAEDPQALLNDLNESLGRLARADRDFAAFPTFTSADLRRLAFFMATGAGKTLLMHVHLWQVLDHLRDARHPEAFVRRADGRNEFDAIILVTPNEGLSEQHLEEQRPEGHDRDAGWAVRAGDAEHLRLERELHERVQGDPPA